MEKSTSSETRDLIKRASEGDKEAVRQFADKFAEKYCSPVRRWILNLGINSVDADDLTHETFLHVLAKISNYEWREGSRFRSWLGVLTRNYVINRLRRRNPSLVDPALLDQLGNAFDRLPEGWFEESNQAISHLQQRAELCWKVASDVCTRKQWACLYGMVVLDRTAEELGTELGIEPANVRQIKHRMLKKLKSIVVKQESNNGSNY